MEITLWNKQPLLWTRLSRQFRDQVSCCCSILTWNWQDLYDREAR